MKIDKSLLGTIEGANQLITDLFLNLRDSVNAWSLVTNQTPQARMGYVGQHLTSIVTGYPGGKSGARGYDIVLPDGQYGEIKTCYRVDQLGSCNKCGNVVSAMEKVCSDCGSSDITRKDDSKWLIGIRNEKEFSEVVDPAVYYFVLFEFEDLDNPENIIASIWEVDPKRPGFALCMADYYLNTRSHSTSKAPFNMWPYAPKFYLACPKLIYRSIIKIDNTIETVVFPGDGQEIYEVFDFSKVSRATTFTVDNLIQCIEQISKGEIDPSTLPRNKGQLAVILERYCQENGIENIILCDCLAEAVYEPLLKDEVENIPQNIRYCTSSFNSTGLFPD